MDLPGSAELFERARALPAVAATMRRLSAEDGLRVALVGGAVRDLILGVPAGDADLAVEGPVEDVLARLGAEARTHSRFGTATVDLDGHQLDLAQTRRESYARPGALPDVVPAKLEEDLQRRDFTVNAMALVLSGEDAGRLLEAPGALEDLGARRLRVLHPGSFVDDPTRLFRLARYQARLGFEIEPGTEELAHLAIGEGAVRTPSGPRIGHELELLARESDPVAGWTAMRELELDEEVEPGFGIAQPDLARRALALLPDGGRPQVVLLALGLAGVPVGARSGLLERLGVPARVRDDTLAVAGRAPDLAVALDEAGRASEIAAAVGDGDVPELVAVAGAIGGERQARAWLGHLRHLRLGIDGADLLAAGVAAGPRVGIGLAAARAALIDGRAGTPQEQLAEALRAAQGSG